MLSHRNIVKYIRKLAKDPYYRTIYSISKEYNIRLFKNDYDLTQIQVMFLQYLSFYQAIYMDISLDEVEDDVLDNEIFEDSYIFYKNNKKEKKPKNTKYQKQEDNQTQVGGFNWVFKKNG